MASPRTRQQREPVPPRGLQPEFREAVEHLDQRCADRLGGRLLAAYLGGSVAAGEVWPGASDVEWFFFTLDEPSPKDREWCATAAQELRNAFPVASAFHLNCHPLARLEAEPFVRWMIERVGARTRG